MIVYGSADNPKLKNRGFAFLEYDSHKSASTAKRKLATGRVKVWQCDIIVDWADPQEEPDDETMSKVWFSCGHRSAYMCVFLFRFQEKRQMSDSAIFTVANFHLSLSP